LRDIQGSGKFIQRGIFTLNHVAPSPALGELADGLAGVMYAEKYYNHGEPIMSIFENFILLTPGCPIVFEALKPTVEPATTVAIFVCPGVA
jgi:hypothetical protein